MHHEPTDQIDAPNIVSVTEQAKPPTRFTGLVSWVTSAALHIAIIMLMATIIFLTKEAETIDLPPLHMVPPPVAREVPPPTKLRDILEKLVDLPIDNIVADTPVNLAIEVPIEADRTTDDAAETDAAKGRTDAVSTIEVGGPSMFIPMGAGPNASGLHGQRNGGRRDALAKHGGGPATEGAVMAALRWFKKHQSANGSWEAERYFQQCLEEKKCEPGSSIGHDPQEINIAMTSYALLCFLGHGHDHVSPNTFKTTVRKGLNYLLSVQKPDGLFGKRNYEHAIATMALVDAYAMTMDSDLRGPAQLGVDVILSRQIRDPLATDKAYARLGWDYGSGETGRNDASVTGWNVMALKSAHAAGLITLDGTEGAKAWLERAWKANNDGKDGRPDWRRLDIYKDQSQFSYTWYPDLTSYEVNRMRGQQLASVALVSAVFLGHSAGDTMMETLANFVMARQMPTAYPTNTYYMYYNTLGIFQVGGERWKTWNTTVSNMLVKAQVRDDSCRNGSWDWEGTGFTGHQIGRVLSTAYCCLSLEVYYRYELMNRGKSALPTH